MAQGDSKGAVSPSGAVSASTDTTTFLTQDPTGNVMKNVSFRFQDGRLGVVAFYEKDLPSIAASSARIASFELLPGNGLIKNISFQFQDGSLGVVAFFEKALGDGGAPPDLMGLMTKAILEVAGQ